MLQLLFNRHRCYVEQPAESSDYDVPEGHVDDFAMWWGERSKPDPDRFPFDRITAARLSEAYREFCSENELRPMSNVAFLRRVKSAGFELYRESTGLRRRYYRVS